MIELRDYQVELSEKLCEIIKKHGMAYLAAEVRTGKTLTVLNTAKLLGKKKVLFVTKKGAISSIEADYAKGGFDFMIKVINHESLDKVVDNFDFVICDENHAVAAFPKPTKRFEVLRKYCAGRDILLLSGTPNPESYSQLYHQFQLSARSPWARYNNFYRWVRDGYVQVRKKKFHNMEINDYSHANKDKVLRDVQHLMVQFSQKEAGFLKEVKEVIQYVALDDSTYRMIAELKRDKIIDEGGNVILADTAVKMQGKLHQLYSGTVKTEGGDGLVVDCSKVQYIKRMYAGKKIAIFYKFIAEKKMIEDSFNDLTTDPFEFNDSGHEKVFYRQYVSGREGINLSSADYLIFLNIDFSAISYLQSKERMMTKEREKEAVAVYLFSIGGIEEKIYKVLQHKKDYTLSYFMRDFGFDRHEFKSLGYAGE